MNPTGEESPADTDFDLVSGQLVGQVPLGRLALLHSRLFWPDFMEVDGIVLLESMIEDDEDRQRLRDSIERNSGDLAQVEREWNFHEVGLLFGGLEGATDEEEDWLSQRLAAMWQARLREQFPGRRFVVEAVRPEPSDGHELGVIFYSAARERPH